MERRYSILQVSSQYQSRMPDGYWTMTGRTTHGFTFMFFIHLRTITPLMRIHHEKVKIIVLDTSFREDLAKEYAMPELKPCSVMKEGQVFVCGLGKPEGFCDTAWKSIHQYVFALANGPRISSSTTGCASRASPSAAATTVSGRCSSRLRRPTRRSRLLNK